MRPSLIGALVVVLLAVAAGCGGSTPSASEQWAESACSATDDWATKMNGYVDDVRGAVTSPSADSVTTIQTAVTNGTQSTKQLTTDLKALGPPPSDGQAAAQVNSFTTQLQQTADQVQGQAQAIQEGSSASDIATAVGTIATEVSAALTKGKSTFDSLRQANSELKEGFENADSCQQLQDDFG
jgi:hypothetical protein